jgi:ABC-type multidrug transport system fused ATPase/permease subunit
VIWVAVGGRGTLIGAVIGAIMVNYAKTLVHRRLPELLAVRARRAVRCGDAVPARGIVGLVTDGLAPHADRQAVFRKRRPVDRVQAAASAGSGGMTSPDQTSLLYLDGVSVAFDGFKAMNSLSLIIEPGEMRAIIGPNGAGKTTMMDVITGKTRPDAGDVLFDGSST